MSNIFNMGATPPPTGIIVMWSGSSNNIPRGWVLCDGQNNTPDLRGKFIMGAADSNPPNTVGGSSTQEIPSHTHSYSGDTGIQKNAGSIDSNRSSGNGPTHIHAYSGTTDSNSKITIDIIPPFYTLCFIMKTGNI